MVSSDSDNSELNELAYDFAQRIRRGERLTILEFAAAHPELATEILELFPALLTIEQFDLLAVTAERNTALSSIASSVIPEKVGEYTILRFIGRGGMGVVYEAVHDSLGRHVALKMLAGGSSTDARSLRRFKCESRAAARLHHSNIVPVFEVGEAAGLHYYAMQLIHGISLDLVLDEVTRIRRPPSDLDRGTHPSTPLDSASTNLPGVSVAHETLVREVFQGSSGLVERDHRYFREVARLGEQAADALACAHRDGILHRDIKPSNLLLDVQGKLWVTDFGLARVDGVSELTSDADLVGTLRYMSPERFDGRVDHRSDVYSLGLTLFEMLTLRPAFSSDNRGELINRILSSQPQPELRSIVGLPRDLATIVSKATAKDPLDRYQTAADLADDLRRYYGGRSIQARRQSYTERLGYWCRRNRTLATMMGTIAILLMGISVESVTASIRLRRQLDQTQAAQTEVRKRLLDSLLFQSRANRRSGDSGRRFRSLDTLRQAKRIADDLDLPPAVIDDIRDETIASLCLADVELACRVAARPVGTASLDFDPSFEGYARIDLAGTIEICRVSDNSVRQRIPTPGLQFQAAREDSVVFSPSGKILQQLCADLDGNLILRLWDVAADPPRMLFDKRDGVASSAVFAADSQRVAVNMTGPTATDDARRSTSFQIHVLDTSTGSQCIEPLPSDHTTRCVFHPKRDQLAISDLSHVRVMDLNQGIEIARWERPHVNCLGWSPDGKQIIAAVADDSRVFRWDVRQRQELAPLIRHVDRPVESITFDHTGHLVITSARFDWRMWNAQTGQMLWESTSPLPNMRFRRDDRLLAGKYEVDPRVGLFRVERGEELHRVALNAPWRDGSPRAVMHFDGRLIAATAREGTILWDVARREQVGFLPGDRVPLSFPTADSLLTQAMLPEGVVRWRLESSADQSGEYRLADPQTLHFLASPDVQTPISGAGIWASSHDGRVIAMAGADGGANLYVSNRDDVEVGQTLDYRKVVLGQQTNVTSTSVSPDGKWVATGSNGWRAQDSRSVTVTVWESATGIRVRDLLIGQTGVPVFSPDGQWIAVLSGQYSGGVKWWRVGTWEEGPRTSPVASPGGITSVAFDPGSRTIAVQGEYIRLLDTGTGREIAKLIVPEKTSLAPQCYSPDGGHLFAFDVYNGQLFDWDLNAIRRQLARRGLDLRR